jgi:PKD repeat protein
VKSDNQGNLWLPDTVDLSAFVGGSVRIRFRGVTGNASQSDMAIDDIGIFEDGAPTAAFSVSPPICVNVPITFTDQTSGTVQTWSWNFGADATPATASTQGPHVVTYSTTGNKTVNLTVTNSLGSSSLNQTVAIATIPSASFNFVTNSLGAVFTQASTGATSYFWDFGDGDTSSLAEPAHIYAASGTYTVTMIAINDCGTDTSQQEVTVVEDGIGQLGAFSFSVTPNPNEGEFVIDSGLGSGLVEVMDALGRHLHSQSFGTSGPWMVQLPDPASGVYFVKVSSGSGVGVRTIVVE